MDGGDARQRRRSEDQPDSGVLRFITAGSVDDGKSTLIGRLLHDSRAILEDQFAAVERASQRRGQDAVDLSLLTDGLEAEREQGITIDVAYRYFATPRRKFIIADTPGHEQYTRNMVTGASTAEAAVVLDRCAQRTAAAVAPAHLSRRAAGHGRDHRRDQQDGPDRLRRSAVSARSAARCSTSPSGCDAARVSFVPISALLRRHGRRARRKPALVDRTHTARSARGGRRHAQPARSAAALPGATGHSARHRRTRRRARLSGTARIRRYPREVRRSPCCRPGADTTIREIVSLEGPVKEAVAGDCVTLLLADDLDISRGD